VSLRYMDFSRTIEIVWKFDDFIEFHDINLRKAQVDGFLRKFIVKNSVQGRITHMFSFIGIFNSHFNA